MNAQIASKLRIAYYAIQATLLARNFPFESRYEAVEDDYRAIVERNAAERHGEGRFVRRFERTPEWPTEAEQRRSWRNHIDKETQ